MKHLLNVSVLVVGLSLSCEAATINWSAEIANGFSLPGGANLSIGDLVRVGTFTIPDAQITANFANPTFLDSKFVDFGDAHIGDKINKPDLFSAKSVNDSDALGIAGAQTYMWVLHSTDNSTPANSVLSAKAEGVFYFAKAQNKNWAIPAQSPVPGNNTIDISDLTDPATNTLLVLPGANLVIGTYGLPVSNSLGSPNFDLLAIPEPASMSLFLVSAVTFLGRRRRVG